ncbi:MAG: hypothetical protein ACTTJC_02740 [Campylobacter sp.]
MIKRILNVAIPLMHIMLCMNIINVVLTALMVYGFSLAIIGLALLVLITCVLAAIIIVYLFT